MRRSKDMSLEKRIFDFCVWFIAGIYLLAILTSCRAAVPLPITPTSEVTATATDQKATLRQESPSPTPQICTVQTGFPSGNLNLRSGPGTRYAVVRVLHEGEILTVTELGTWLEVSDNQGNQGYVNPRFCR
jgi:uncharacterized protein YgiM (DUF1202 family)